MKEPIYIAIFKELTDSGTYTFKNLVEKLEDLPLRALLKDILSRKEEALRFMYSGGRGHDAGQVAFHELRKLPLQNISAIKNIIESIFREAEKKPDSKDSKNIFNNIRVLVLLKRNGLSVGFLNKKRLLNTNLPIRTRIDLAKLLVFLDPLSKTFDWEEEGLFSDHPHLLPATISLSKNEPELFLYKVLSVEKEPSGEIVEAIRKRALKTCLENLLIRDNKYDIYVRDIEPLLNNHWVGKSVNTIISYPIFVKNGIDNKLKEAKERQGSVDSDSIWKKISIALIDLNMEDSNAEIGITSIESIPKYFNSKQGKLTLDLENTINTISKLKSELNDLLIPKYLNKRQKDITEELEQTIIKKIESIIHNLQIIHKMDLGNKQQKKLLINQNLVFLKQTVQKLGKAA